MDIWKSVIIDKFNKTKYIINEAGVIINTENGNKIPTRYNKKYLRCSLNYTVLSKVIYRSFLVHLLVADAFIPNPNNLPEVNHIDEDRSNPHVTNLERCTRSYNINYGKRNDNSRISQKRPIVCIIGNKKAIYISAHKAAELCNCHWVSISEVVRGKKKTLFNSKWRLATEEEVVLLNNKYHYGDDIKLQA